MITAGRGLDLAAKLTRDAPRYLPPGVHRQPSPVLIESGCSTSHSKRTADLLCDGFLTGQIARSALTHLGSMPNDSPLRTGLMQSGLRTTMGGMTKAWVIRSGRYGERDAWAIETGHSGGGWREVPNLTSAATHDQVARAVAIAFPDASPSTLSTQTGQVWAMRGRIEAGDLMVMPMKTTGRIAIGQVIGGYHYLEDEPDPDRRHVLNVEWQRQDIPRTAVKQDLLYTLGSALSIFAPSKNDAVNRLKALLATGVDPGQSGAPKAATAGAADPVDQPESDLDTEEVSRDRITARVNEEFKGHGLAELVAAILEAEGFTCTVSPPGPDQGIDIVAGKGPLGIDSPRVIVQVKSGGTVGAPVVNQLNGVVNQHNADQGLLVAWDGLTGPARDAMRNMQLRIALWESTDVVRKLLAVYDRLPAHVTARIPLRQVWMLAP